VSEYRLTAAALDDIEEILLYVFENYGFDRSIQLEDALFARFEQLALFPGLGHRRSDLTKRPFLFFPERPYLIIYERDVDPLIIHAVLHASRNAARYLTHRKS
jgi:plasmid stabilization system protein ParE